MTNPKEVGADRIVNAVAAFEQVKGPVIVVDFAPPPPLMWYLLWVSIWAG